MTIIILGNSMRMELIMEGQHVQRLQSQWRLIPAYVLPSQSVVTR